MERSLLRDGLSFAEGPRWRDGVLWVSDITAQEILCLDSGGEVLRRLSTPGQPSGLGWLPDGTLLAVMMDQRSVLRHDGDWQLHADLTGFSTAPMNDMVVSSSGNAYVTGLGYRAQVDEPAATQIVLVRPDGSAEAQEGELWRPNGCVITPDGTRLIVAETRVHRLTEFRIAGDGRLADQRTFGVLPEGTWADGICLDAEGAIWAADPRTKACHRVTADGRVDTTIDTSPTACIACTLGGADGRTLFLLLGNLRDFERPEARSSRIETIRVDVPGAGSP